MHRNCFGSQAKLLPCALMLTCREIWHKVRFKKNLHAWWHSQQVPCPKTQQTNLPIVFPHYLLKCCTKSRETVNTNLLNLLLWLDEEIKHIRLRSGRSYTSKSAVWPRGLKRRFYGDRVIKITCLGSTPTLGSHVVASWIRCVTTIFSAWWLRTSSKLSCKKSKNNWKIRKWTLLNGLGFVQNISSFLLSRDRRIKLEKRNTSELINEEANLFLYGLFTRSHSICEPNKSIYFKQVLYHVICLSFRASIPPE